MRRVHHDELHDVIGHPRVISHFSVNHNLMTYLCLILGPFSGVFRGWFSDKCTENLKSQMILTCMQSKLPLCMIYFPVAQLLICFALRWAVSKLCMAKFWEKCTEWAQYDRALLCSRSKVPICIMIYPSEAKLFVCFGTFKFDPIFTKVHWMTQKLPWHVQGQNYPYVSTHDYIHMDTSYTSYNPKRLRPRPRWWVSFELWPNFEKSAPLKWSWPQIKRTYVRSTYMPGDQFWSKLLNMFEVKGTHTIPHGPHRLKKSSVPFYYKSFFSYNLILRKVH